MSEYTFLYINHSWLKLTVPPPAIVFTKHCWYCSQQFHSYALSFLLTASFHNYTKLNMCIWLWCVAKHCPWLPHSTLPPVILIPLHSVTELYWALLMVMHSKCLVTVVGQHDTVTLLMAMHSKCLVTVVGQHDTVTLFTVKYHGD